MVFSFKSQQNSVLKKIQYVAKEDDIIKRLNQLMLSLKDLNINFFLDKYLNSTCIRIRLLQLPNIRKKFTNIFPGVLFQIIWKFGYDIIQPFPRVNFLCFTGSTECFFLGTEYTDFTEKNKENPRFPCIPCLKKSSSVFLHPLFVFGDSLKIYLFIIFLKSSAICCPILTIALSTLCTSAGVTASL